jgi:hypothetical protein
MKHLYIGIDPGTQTGLAIWDKRTRKFSLVATMQIHKAMAIVELHKENIALIRCEDPNTWKPYNGTSRADRSKLQGAGSVKRDYKIWSDYALDKGIPFAGVSLQASMKKVPATLFRLITKHTERTSEHARDAAMLVFQL